MNLGDAQPRSPLLPASAVADTLQHVGYPPRRVRAVPTIRIPASQWGKVWRVLIASGPISRVSQEPVYLVSDRQLRLLRRKKLPFQLAPLAYACREPLE